MEAIECLKNRKSTKSFLSTQIKDEDLKEILEVGMNAPSGKGLQSAKMVVIQNKEERDLLSKLNYQILMPNDEEQKMVPFYNAPTVIVVFADSNIFTHIEDGSLVMGNLLNAAYALDLGACWIHRAKEMFETEQGKELMKKWGITENYVGIGNCVIGYKNPDKDLPKKDRKPDYVVYSK